MKMFKWILIPLSCVVIVSGAAKNAQCEPGSEFSLSNEFFPSLSYNLYYGSNSSCSYFDNHDQVIMEEKGHSCAHIILENTQPAGSYTEFQALDSAVNIANFEHIELQGSISGTYLPLGSPSPYEIDRIYVAIPSLKIKPIINRIFFGKATSNGHLAINAFLDHKKSQKIRGTLIFSQLYGSTKKMHLRLLYKRQNEDWVVAKEDNAAVDEYLTVETMEIEAVVPPNSLIRFEVTNPDFVAIFDARLWSPECFSDGDESGNCLK